MSIVAKDKENIELTDKHRAASITTNNVINEQKSIAFQQLHQTYGKNIFEWIKKEIDITSFLAGKLVGTLIQTAPQKTF